MVNKMTLDIDRMAVLAMCCKDKLEAQEFFECTSLGSNLKERSHKLHLSLHITSG